MLVSPVLKQPYTKLLAEEDFLYQKINIVWLKQQSRAQNALRVETLRLLRLLFLGGWNCFILICKTELQRCLRCTPETCVMLYECALEAWWKWHFTKFRK